MTFIVILLALLVERFFDWSHVRGWHWMPAVQARIYNALTGQSSTVVFATMFALLYVCIWVAEALIGNAMYGFVKLIAETLLLLYCFGPQNFWADVFAAINALVYGNSSDAALKLNLVPNHSSPLHDQIVAHIFYEANQRVIAVLFWYLLLGPFGAIFYRAIALLAKANQQPILLSADISSKAERIKLYLDWPVIRLFIFLFAIGDHFVEIMRYLQKHFFVGLDSNQSLLTACMQIVMGVTHETILPHDGSAERHAVRVIDKALVFFLAVVALGVLMF